MTIDNFFSTEISQELEELGCESQFDYLHTDTGIFPRAEIKHRQLNNFAYSPHNDATVAAIAIDHERYRKLLEEAQTAFCLSDLLIKQNAILVFGEEIEKTIIHPNPELSSRTRIFGWKFHIHHLLDLYNSGGEWEKYVSNFLKK